MMKSLSGPSGKVDGSKFVFDEVRSRFVHPQDKSFVVYFEWDAPAATHSLIAQWKRPDGGIDSISPEMKIESKGGPMNAYWTYTISPEMQPGVWQVEVRIDGQPAGTHAFEIAGTSTPRATVVETAAAAPKKLTLDEIYRRTLPSIVWVRKYDAVGVRSDVSSGFVVGKDRVLTAFQTIDGATKLEIETASGAKATTDQVLACSRTGDWAVLSVPTGEIAPLALGSASGVAVGDRVVTFAPAGTGWNVGGVDISGRRTTPGYGERLQFDPALPKDAAGGPMLDLSGKVVAILGGSTLPGTRLEPKRTSVNPALRLPRDVAAASLASALPDPLPAEPRTLTELSANGTLTAPMGFMEEVLYVTTSTEDGKSAIGQLPPDVGEFARSDKQIWVVSRWQKRGKLSKGSLGARVYDSANRVRVESVPKKVNLSSTPTIASFSFSPAPLAAGVYRIDITWDNVAVWRTFVQIRD